MKNQPGDQRSEGCAQSFIAGLVVVVMIPVGYIMNAFGFSMGWIIGFGVVMVVLCLSITEGK